MFDADDPKKLYDLNAHDFIGRFDFQLSKVISGKN